MALKRKTKVADTFSMASMTDVIFLLLIFFLVTSTIIVPNTIKVTLPTSAPQSAPETPSARVTLTPDLHYYLSIDRGTPTELTRDQLKEQLGIFAAEHPEASSPYRPMRPCPTRRSSPSSTPLLRLPSR